MGRGLFATAPVLSEELIHRSETIKVLDAEVDKCPTLAAYVFMHTKKYSLMALGHGPLFNHSENFNVHFYVAKFEGRLVIEFVATRDIAENEEFFIYYGGEKYAFAHKLK